VSETSDGEWGMPKASETSDGGPRASETSDGEWGMPKASETSDGE
jgi:hypothetical protein